MQSILKDTKGESYELWMERGLECLVGQIETSFQLTKFRHIFDTFCVFMESCFPKIAESTQSLIAFLRKVSSLCLEHPNKYLRKFMLKALSYVLTNIE